MKRTSRAVLAGLSMLMVAGAGWGSQGARIWAVNLGSDPIEVKVERGLQAEALRVGREKRMEVRRAADEEIRIVDQSGLLLVTASTGFDPASLRVEGSAPGAEEPRAGTPAALAKARPGQLLKRGDAASSTLLWTGAGPLAVRVKLHGPLTSAEIRVSRPDGPALGYVTLAASRDVEVTVDLRGFMDRNQYWGPVKQEVEVRRGELSTSLEGSVSRGGVRGLLKTIVGSGVYNQRTHYTSVTTSVALYYNVTGGPASTCGELNSYRNGSWIFGPGWLCTDASGNATKGPWYTAGGNQTDDPSFIRWPGGSTTTNDWHIWDNSCPSISYGSSAPPNSWGGSASDAVYGACFKTTTRVYSWYKDVTANTYWTPSTGAYSTASYTEVNGSLGGAPGCSVTWATSRPAVSAHTPGHTYRWGVCTNDGGCTACTGYYQFTY